MKSIKDFEQLNNHVDLSIHHASVGTFHRTLCDVNRLPHNRLYFICQDSTERSSYIYDSNNTKERNLLKQGYIYLIPRNYPLGFSFEVGLKIVAFHFDLEFIPGIDLFDHETMTVALDDHGHFGQQISREMTEEMSIQSIILIRSMTLGAVSRFLPRVKIITDSFSYKMDKHKELFQILSSRVHASHSVKTLAHRLGVSSSCLSKKFSRDFNMSLKHYLDERLRKEVNKHIVMSKSSFHEIAMDLGFSDVSYFSTYTKRHFGLSPRQMRVKSNSLTFQDTAHTSF